MVNDTLDRPASASAGSTATTPPHAAKRPAPERAEARPKTMSKPAFPTPPLPEDLRAQGVFVNLVGDYTYLTDGYYRSMEAEHEGLLAIPTPAEALDAYVVPLALGKAAGAGINVPDWEIAQDTGFGFKPPLIVYPVNPYQSTGQVIAEEIGLNDTVKSLTMSGKYAMVVQHMSPDSR